MIGVSIMNKEYRKYNEYSHSTLSSATPDDDFSEKIMNVVGDRFLYRGSSLDDNNIKQYRFFIWIHDTDSIDIFAKTINQYCDLVDEKTQIIIMDGSASSMRVVLSFNNFTISDSEYFDLKGFYGLDIVWINLYDFWKTPSTYTNIEDVQWLALPDTLQKKADEEKIDWHEIWPNLEQIIIYETDTRNEIIK